MLLVFVRSNYKALPSGINLRANGYYLISRPGNTLDADLSQFTSITSNYCVVLANSMEYPNSPTSSNVIDFVAFGAADTSSRVIGVKGEGNKNSLPLDNGYILRRQRSCLYSDKDTNHNFNDFELITDIPPSYVIRNSMRSNCASIIMTDGENISDETSKNLIIAEVGNKINNILENDYIVFI